MAGEDEEPSRHQFECRTTTTSTTLARCFAPGFPQSQKKVVQAIIKCRSSLAKAQQNLKATSKIVFEMKRVMERKGFTDVSCTCHAVPTLSVDFYDICGLLLVTSLVLLLMLPLLLLIGSVVLVRVSLMI